MRNRVALLAAIGLFAVAVAAAAVVADRAGDSDRGPQGLTPLSYDGGTIGETGAQMALYREGPVEYRLGRTINKPAATAPAYRLLAPTDKQEAALRNALESHGQGDAKNELRLDRKTGLWTYGPDGDTSVSAPAVQGCYRPDPSVDDCQPRRAASLPSPDAAEEFARSFWMKAGVELGTAKVHVADHMFSMFVRFESEVGGLRLLPLQFTVGVGPNTTLLSATGWLGDVEPIGDYPLVDIEEAVERLNNPQSWASDEPRPEPAIDPPTWSGSPTTHPPDARRTAPETTFAVPHPTVVTTPPQPQVVTLVDVRIALQSNGTHLVPVYVFSTGPGAEVWPVPAVPKVPID